VLLMRIERASAVDVPAVEALLAAAGLPLEGAAEALATAGVVARADDAVAGAAAVECYGEAGLLRSVVVSGDRHGTGVGRALVAAAEGLASASGVRSLYLVTETAEGWFSRLGYEVVAQYEARAAVGSSVELGLACATTGVAMRRTLPR
jgi:amino-acid N-acetyltransferase